MNDRNLLPPLTLSIAAVERDTGLSKDTLRVWERRYGFPAPARDSSGERCYAQDQIEKLRLVKRLMDAGHRPGRIVGLSFDELQRLADAISSNPLQPAGSVPTVSVAVEVAGHMALIRGHDLPGLRAGLYRALSRLGVARFVLEVVSPLNAAVGDAWIRGQMQVFEEHMYTEAVQGVLRQAIAAIPGPAGASRPRVVLTTFPGEPHGLGLLMAEALLALEGCICISLGAQTPLWDITLAAAAHRSDIVALSFTGCMNPNQVVDGLTELRRKLPRPVRLWAGGSAPVLNRRRVEGVDPMGSLQALPEAVRLWRVSAA